LKSTVSGSEIPFFTKSLSTCSLRFDLIENNTGATVATAHTGPLSKSRPISLWRERDPLGGRLFLPLLALREFGSGNVVAGDVVGELEMEFVVVTWFDHPLMDVASTTDVNTWKGTKVKLPCVCEGKCHSFHHHPIHHHLPLL
jgi:hypothetical protein